MAATSGVMSLEDGAEDVLMAAATAACVVMVYDSSDSSDDGELKMQTGSQPGRPRRKQHSLGRDSPQTQNSYKKLFGRLVIPA